VRKTNRCICK